IDSYLSRGGRVIGGSSEGHAFGTPPSRNAVGWLPPNSPIYPAVVPMFSNPSFPEMKPQVFSFSPPAPSGMQVYTRPAPIPSMHMPINENPTVFAIANSPPVSYAPIMMIENPTSTSMNVPMDFFRSNACSGTGYAPPQHPIMPNFIQQGFFSQPQAVQLPPKKDEKPMGDLLLSYRNNGNKSLKLHEISGHVLEFAKDQLGSRFIQQKLEACDIDEKDAIFDEVVKFSAELVNDIFGNYVVQKFLEFGERRQVRISNVRLSSTAKSSEFIEEPLQLLILAEIEKSVLKCMEDQNGNHVIQKAVERVKSTRVQFIVDALLLTEDMVHKMSVHTYGCRVVQRVLEHCTEAQYGNYVVQHMVIHGSKGDKAQVVNRIASDVLKYAKHKFASNVLEKCLIHGDSEQKGFIINMACDQTMGTTPAIVHMMKDPFANYVVQKMFDVADSEHCKKIMMTIKPYISTLRTFQYGKHIIGIV
ncbi:unnamed protein product, partial [Caenorhabditis auriculariae]